jgi:hypothetical protein
MSDQPTEPMTPAPVEQQALPETLLPPSQTDLCLRSYPNPVPDPAASRASKRSGAVLRCTLLSGHEGEHGQQEA